MAGVVVVVIMFFTIYHRNDIARFFHYADASAEYNVTVPQLPHDDYITVKARSSMTTKTRRDLLMRIAEKTHRRTLKWLSAREITKHIN